MNESSGALVELDQLGKSILRGLDNHGGEATSSEVRSLLGVKDADRFNYRIREHLVPNGLIETHQPAPDSGRYPPKELTLTEEGKEYIEAENERGSVGEIADRLNRLEEQVDGLRQENQELREENESLKELVEGSDVEMVTGRVQELTDDVDRLQAKVSNLQDALGDLNGDPLIGNDLARVNLNTAFILGNALRELLVEEWSEDRVMNMVGEKKEKFEESDDLI